MIPKSSCKASGTKVNFLNVVYRPEEVCLQHTSLTFCKWCRGATRPGSISSHHASAQALAVTLERALNTDWKLEMSRQHLTASLLWSITVGSHHCSAHTRMFTGQSFRTAWYCRVKIVLFFSLVEFI